MNKRLVPLVILIAIVALLAATLPAFGAPPKATPVSGLECVYVDTPGEMEIIGQTVFIRGQVNVNRFISDDPTAFPNGTNTAVLDVRVSLKTGMIVWSAEAIFQPDGMEGTFEGFGQGWFKTDPATGATLDGKGVGVFHGTGELEGLTLKQDLYPADPTECPGTAFDASWWQGFIVPPDP